MESTRKPAVAGMFYPGNPQELAEMVDRFIDQANVDSTVPKAVIAPHAGYVYSGSIAGTAYAFLKNGASHYRRVVLLGPAHRVPVQGIAACSSRYFETPLGKVPVDTEAIAQISSLPFVRIFDAAHEQEHSLEVQLPFLQEVFSSFMLVPLVVGHASPEDLVALLELLVENDETVIVVSSDLSHYHEYRVAKEIDARTSRQIEDLAEGRLSADEACGAFPVKGLLRYAKKHGLKARTVHLANSGDTAGSKREGVVGYGAYIFV